MTSNDPGTERTRAGIQAKIWLCIAGLLVLAIRKTDSFAHPQFWAEDGPVFFLEADVSGWRSVLHPYSGYLHLIPRLVAMLCRALDPLWIPAAYNVISAALALFAAGFIFSPRLKLPHKPLLFLAPFLVVHSGEVFCNLTNAQWLLALLLPQLALLGEPTHARQRITDVLLLIVVGLTGPFVFIFFPLFLLRCYSRRTRFSLVLAVIAGVAAVVQGALLIHDTHPPANPSELSSALFIHAFAGRGVAATFLSSSLAARLIPAWQAVVGLGIIGVLTRLGVSSAIRRSETRAPLLVFGVGLVLIFSAVAFKFRHELPALEGFENGDRYFYLPRVFLLWLVVISLGPKPRATQPAFVILFASLLAALPTFRAPPLVDFDWAKYARQIGAGQPSLIPVNPPGFSFPHPGRR